MKKDCLFFWKCQQSFDLVDWHSKNFKARFDYVFANCSEYENRWNSSLDWIGKSHDRWMTDAHRQQINLESDRFLKGFWEIYHNWVKDDFYRDMYVAEKKLVDPLIQHCRDMQPDYNALFLLEPLLKCKDAVENHRNLRKISVEEFNMYSEQLDKIYLDLDASLKELKITQRY